MENIFLSQIFISDNLLYLIILRFVSMFAIIMDIFGGLIFIGNLKLC